MTSIPIGDVRVTLVRHTVLSAAPASRFFPDLDPVRWRANLRWLEPDHVEPDTGRVLVAQQSWLVRTPDTTILVDTGLTPRPTRPGVPPGPDLLALLAAHGVGPEDVDVVVNTHLHADHVGNNTVDTDRGPVPGFPRAKYLFSRPDLEFFDPDEPVAEPGRSSAVFAQSVAPIIDKGQAVVWEGEHRIDATARLVAAPGHTPGSAVLEVVSGGRRGLFVGDLLHSPFQLVEPRISSATCHDPRRATAQREQWLTVARRHDATVFTAHFTGTGAVRPGRADADAPRWVP